jgi:hypothetical protein
MRALTFAIGVALLLGGCMTRAPRSDPGGQVSYNRRELPPAQGLFTGCDGAWTVYRNNPDRAPEECPPSPDEQPKESDPSGEMRRDGEAPPE